VNGEGYIVLRSEPSDSDLFIRQAVEAEQLLETTLQIEEKTVELLQRSTDR
jgi:hypothetical protein